jgi:hypothetical protein
MLKLRLAARIAAWKYSWNYVSGTAMVDPIQRMQDRSHGYTAQYTVSLMGALWPREVLYKM